MKKYLSDLLFSQHLQINLTRPHSLLHHKPNPLLFCPIAFLGCCTAFMFHRHGRIIHNIIAFSLTAQRQYIFFVEKPGFRLKGFFFIFSTNDGVKIRRSQKGQYFSEADYKCHMLFLIFYLVFFRFLKHMVNNRIHDWDKNVTPGGSFL